MNKMKLRAVWDLIWSRNWVIICDRNSSASVRTPMAESHISELRLMAYKLAKLHKGDK